MKPHLAGCISTQLQHQEEPSLKLPSPVDVYQEESYTPSDRAALDDHLGALPQGHVEADRVEEAERAGELQVDQVMWMGGGLTRKVFFCELLQIYFCNRYKKCKLKNNQKSCLSLNIFMLITLFVRKLWTNNISDWALHCPNPLSLVPYRALF